MEAMKVMKLVAASALLAAGYLLLDRYAPQAADRISNGYHPMGLLGSLLELWGAFWLISMTATPYLKWSQQFSLRRRSELLGTCILMNAGFVWWTASAHAHYRAQLPPMLGTYWRFYFTPLPLWTCVASFLITLQTLRLYGSRKAD